MGSREEPHPGRTRSVEGLRELRLLALLRDMVDGDGGVRTAKTLGVSYRTLARTMRSGQLMERMARALERHLLLGGGSAAAEQRLRVEELAGRVALLEGELAGGLGALRELLEHMQEEHARVVRHTERRLIALEATGSRPAVSAVCSSEEERTGPEPRWRLHRELVTEEPEPGEEQIYGEATPLIAEWRRARAERLGAGTRVDVAGARSRVLELEIAMISEHGLTLPPATYPWDWEERREQVRRRTRALEAVGVELRRALRRRWVRRVLTAGWWD